MANQSIEIVIVTTTEAVKKPETSIEYDGPVLVIRKGRVVELYTFVEFPAGLEGRAFRLVKDRTVEEYNVFVGRNGQDHICDCIGQLQHGRCKHVDAMKHLIGEGEI